MNDMQSGNRIEAGPKAREILRAGAELQSLARRLVEDSDRIRSEVLEAFRQLRADMVDRELARIPLIRLKDTTQGRLRLEALGRAGYRSVVDVYEESSESLMHVPGVGQQTAYQVVAAARQVAAAVEHDLKFRIDLDPQNQKSTALISALARLRLSEQHAAPLRDSANQLIGEFAGILPAANAARGKIQWLFTGHQRRDAARFSLDRAQVLIGWATNHGINALFTRALQVAATPAPPSATAWKDFEQRAAEYYGMLEEVAGFRLDIAASEGFLPEEIVARVNEQELDETFRRVSLRGYQAFGARFALVQRRVIIGDEMGLGKTIEAIAAIAHLKATGATHFLVVCPSSVLINWIREVAARSDLKAYKIHGLDRSSSLRTWVKRGDVAVTTFETLRNIDLPDDVSIAMLVVDEAHYIKNPSAQRSRTVVRFVGRSERVLFLTGTPMENRVEEFRNLVRYLQPNAVNGHMKVPVGGR